MLVYFGNEGAAEDFWNATGVLFGGNNLAFCSMRVASSPAFFRLSRSKDNLPRYPVIPPNIRAVRAARTVTIPSIVLHLPFLYPSVSTR